MRRLRWWGGWVAVFLGLAMLAGTAFAAPAVLPVYGPDWRMIALGAIALIPTLLGLYAVQVERRVTRIEAAVAAAQAANSALQRSLDREYHTKADTDRRFDRIDESVAAVHRRLDFLRIPAASRLIEGSNG